MPWKRITKDSILFDRAVQSWCNTPKFKCPNYGHNWTCPPEAPYLEDEIMCYENFFLIYWKENLSNSKQRTNSSSKQSNEMKKRRSKGLRKYEDMRNNIEKEVNNFLELNADNLEMIRILWDGHCRTCEKEGKKCTYDDEEPCRHPDKKRYSMESVGINVTETVKKAGIDIEWPPVSHVMRFALICGK